MRRALYIIKAAQAWGPQYHFRLPVERCSPPLQAFTADDYERHRICLPRAMMPDDHLVLTLFLMLKPTMSAAHRQAQSSTRRWRSLALPSLHFSKTTTNQTTTWHVSLFF